MRNRFTHLWQLLGQTISVARVYLQGYKSYKVILSQTVTSAPVVLQELENSLGLEVTYSYAGIGEYTVSLSKALFTDKNYTVDGLLYSVHITPEIVYNGSTNVWTSTASFDTANSVKIHTTQSGDTGGVLDFPLPKDTVLSNVLNSNSIFEIRVYNK
jgi:hypothetical protein